MIFRWHLCTFCRYKTLNFAEFGRFGLLLSSHDDNSPPLFNGWIYCTFILRSVYCGTLTFTLQLSLDNIMDVFHSSPLMGLAVGHPLSSFSGGYKVHVFCTILTVTTYGRPSDRGRDIMLEKSEMKTGLGKLYLEDPVTWNSRSIAPQGIYSRHDIIRPVRCDQLITLPKELKPC